MRAAGGNGVPSSYEEFCPAPIETAVDRVRSSQGPGEKVVCRGGTDHLPDMPHRPAPLFLSGLCEFQARLTSVSRLKTCYPFVTGSTQTRHQLWVYYRPEDAPKNWVDRSVDRPGLSNLAVYEKKPGTLDFYDGWSSSRLPCFVGAGQ